MSSKPPAPKISLAFGKQKVSLAKPKAPASAAGATRPRATFDHSDDEDEKATETRTITSFAGGKAIDENALEKVEALRVIAPPPELKEGGWLERALNKKRQKSSLPSRQQEAYIPSEGDTGESQIAHGLTVVPKRDEEVLPEADQSAVVEDPAPVRKTDDELALQALIEGKAEDDRVIPTIVSEKEAFQQAYQEAPAMSSIAEYEATPIEGFGAALLRGMGWKDGQPIGRNRSGPDVKPRVLERRPALLGIGAKPEDATGDEPGAWGKADKKKGRQQQHSYVPVILRNKKTGEEITEEELKARQERQKKLPEPEQEKQRPSRSPARERSERKRIADRDDDGDARIRRDRYDDRERRRERDSDRGDTRNHRDDRDRDRDRNRDTHRSHRDRSPSPPPYPKRRRSPSPARDRGSRKERRRDDDYDSRRDKDRARDRDDSYDSRRDKERARDRSSDRDRDRRRRDNDRPSHRDRDRR